MRALAPCYEDPKVVAVGECGLDYHWPVPKDAQLALFEAEIRLALELDKPLSCTTGRPTRMSMPC